MLKPSFSRGDTLVEVMFAVAIFSLVAVGALSIMNQGSATAQRALEITLVRQEIDSQAETLRFFNSSYIKAVQTGATIDPASSTPAGQWARIQKITVSEKPKFDETVDGCPKTALDKSFIINTHTAQVDSVSTDIKQATTFSQVAYSPNFEAQGIWISAVTPTIPVGVPGYIDFHIEACWDSPGQSIPATLGTIVRLYEP